MPGAFSSWHILRKRKREENKMDDKLILNVYDDNDNIVKTSEAKLIDLRFGTIRSLMELLKVDDINDTAELLKTVYGAWSQIIGILNRVFPDMTEEDWENIKLSELLPILVVILKSSFVQILSIPSDSKN
jgi:hypothetical protein